MTRVLGTWVAALIVASSAAAVAQQPHHPPPAVVRTTPGGTRDRDWDAGEVPGVPSTVVEVTDTTAAPIRTATTKRPSTTTTAAPKASPLVAQTAKPDSAGVWVVRKDGTGLRKVEAQCRNGDYRAWLSESELLVNRDGAHVPFRMRLDGSITTYPKWSVTLPDTGQEIQLMGVGSLSPDRRQMALSYGGYAYGVAVVDLATGQATVTKTGDNPTPVWSPTGEVLLVSSGSATLYGSSGPIRTTTPSPVGMMAPFLQWSPNGSRILGKPMSDWNAWVLFDPHTGASQKVPALGPGGSNEVMWGSSSTLVIGESGIDHQVKPTTRTYDLATGTERVIAQAAHHPNASTASGLIAYEDATTYRSIGIVSLDGARKGDLVTTPAGLWPSPGAWSPSGDQLLFHVCPSGRPSGGLPST